MKVSLRNDEILPFPGYRTRKECGLGFERGYPESYSSIEHYYQSEKFRGVDEAFRQRIMAMPTAKEARKAARKRSDLVRPDWEYVRNKVMATAIYLKLSEHDRYAQALLKDEGLAYKAYAFQDHYWGDFREGVSIGFYRRILLAYRAKRQTGVMRVLVTGSSSFKDYEALASKLKSIFRNKIPDEILINCDRGADSLAEEWALQNQIPVRHFPLRGSQSKTERLRRADEVLSQTTHAVVFWQGVSPRIAEIVSAVKARTIPLRLFKVDSTGQITAAPLRGARQRGS